MHEMWSTRRELTTFFYAFYYERFENVTIYN